MENRGKRQASSIFGGMGFYIALLVCVLAAGVVGYFALSNNKTETDQDQVQAVDQTDPGPAESVDAPEDDPALPVISDHPVVVPAPQDDVEPTAPVSGEDQEDTHITFMPKDTVDTPEELPETEPAASDASTGEEQEPAQVVLPLEGETVAVFSAWELTYDATLGDWRTHDGIDIQAPAGTSVVSACDGTVLSVEEDSRLGTTVTVDHNNGYVTTYASLQPDPLVVAGDAVTAGSVIGTVGNSSLTESALGAHLHLSVSKDGEPVDPQEFLGIAEPTE